MMNDIISILEEKVRYDNERGILFLSEHQQRGIHKQGAQSVFLVDGDFSPFFSTFLEIDLMGKLSLANQMNRNFNLSRVRETGPMGPMSVLGGVREGSPGASYILSTPCPLVAKLQTASRTKK